MEPPIVTASSTVAAGSDLQEDGTLRDETMKSALEVSDKEKNKESRYEILRLDKIWDKKTRRFRSVPTRKPEDQKRKFAKYVFTVARLIGTNGTFKGDYNVTIRGSHIQEALSKIHDEVEVFSTKKAISLNTSDLDFLYHALPRLTQVFEEEKLKKSPNQTKIFELEAAIKFTQEHFQSTIITLRELPEGQMNFETIWVLFPYHSLVLFTDGLGQPTVHRVKETGYKENREGIHFFSVEADCIDSDGAGFGSISVHDLPFLPLSMCRADSEATISQILQLADKTIRLKGRRLYEYQGHAITQISKASREETVKFNVSFLSALSHGRVMIDPKGFNEIMPINIIVPFVREHLAEASLTNEQKLLINPLAYGFSLGDKTWGAFAVSRLEEVSWNESLAESVVLSEQRKTFIRSLVKHYSAPERTGCLDDFVRDKGKGLIGLLAGPPGVGKTLTAEMVAEIAHRPLYTMTAVELGDSPASVQKHLMTVFELAERWKAVVLLDEADVFLTARGDSLSSNAITSIFLRHLEYYQGILLLTTNRLTSLDDAFKSRIHFAFEFDELSEEARETIWRRFLARAHVDLGKDGFAKLSKIRLNGRQIKNIANISHAVAQESNKTITVESIMLTMDFTNVTWEKACTSDQQCDE